MTNVNAEISSLTRELESLKKRIAELRRQTTEPVKNYVLDSMEGPKSLSDFFGDKDELVVVHNMGQACNYCSLWADGLTGFTKHIQTRAGFVLVSADPIERLSLTADRRGWNFPIASNGESGFAVDMGFEGADGPGPGISAFTRRDGQIYRHGWSELGPGDEFCSIWGIWDLFPTGDAGWEPK